MSSMPENLQQDGQRSRRVVKFFAICTIVVTLLGLATSVICGVIVALGWKDLRAGSGDDGTFGTIVTSTELSHTAYWLTVVLSVLFYVATLLLKMRKPQDARRSVPRKRAWKA